MGNGTTTDHDRLIIVETTLKSHLVECTSAHRRNEGEHKAMAKRLWWIIGLIVAGMGTTIYLLISTYVKIHAS